MHLLHFADLSQVGGIERNLVQLIRETARNGTYRHSVFADSPRPHPFLKADLADQLLAFAAVKYRCGVKIPRWPAALRIAHQNRWMRRIQPDLALLWHWFGDLMRIDICRRAGVPAVYWERGLAWGTGGKHTQAFLRATAGVLANATAGKRMLELRWGYRGDTVVIPNAVIPRRSAAACLDCARNNGAPFRLGTAGRLRSFKGVNLALHTLALLRKDGRHACLNIAGEGPLLAPLQRLAARLGIADWVYFHGLVDDMAAFYSSLDCLLHPALREPFGSVCVEAQAYGCPVLSTQVDGMPEVILEGRSGYCLPADISLDQFADYDGDTADVHALVYDPQSDRLRAPAFTAPAAFAERIAVWIDNPETHAEFRQAALTHARERFSLARHLRRVEDALSGFAAEFTTG